MANGVRKPRKRFLLMAGVAFAFAHASALGGGGLNPATPGLPLVDNVYGRNGIPNNNVSAMCLSCHTQAPIPDRATHFVAHYNVNSGANRTTFPANIPLKERTSAWSGSGASSRYGNFLTWTSDNTTSGELICESCHNIVRNVAGGNNLLESSLPLDFRPGQPNDLNSATSTLCEGCHVTGTLPGHHPMTGDTTSSGAPFSTADSPSVRGFVNPTAEMGGTGSEVYYPAANTLPCMTCHGNGHQGFTGTGARILRRGFGRGAAPGGAVVGKDNTSIDRQYDIDTTGVNRLIPNYTPLCDACHKTND